MTRLLKLGSWRDGLKGMNSPQEFFIFHLHADASILLSTHIHIRGQLKDDLTTNATQFQCLH